MGSSVDVLDFWTFTANIWENSGTQRLALNGQHSGRSLGKCHEEDRFIADLVQLGPTILTEKLSVRDGSIGAAQLRRDNGGDDVSLPVLSGTIVFDRLSVRAISIRDA